MPHANEKYVRHYWHMVYMAMDEQGLDYEEMFLLTLGTIAAETGNSISPSVSMSLITARLPTAA